MSGRKNPKHFEPRVPGVFFTQRTYMCVYSCIWVFVCLCGSVIRPAPPQVAVEQRLRAGPSRGPHAPRRPPGVGSRVRAIAWQGREGWRASDGKAKKAELVLRIFRGVSVVFFWVVCHSRSKSKIIRHESPPTILRRGPTGCLPPTRTPIMPTVRGSMPNSDVRQDATLEISPRNIINRVSTDHCPQVCSVMS